MLNANKEILFIITAESINLKLQLKLDPNATPLSIEALKNLCIQLDFPKRFHIFQNFMPAYVEIQR